MGMMHCVKVYNKCAQRDKSAMMYVQHSAVHESALGIGNFVHFLRCENMYKVVHGVQSIVEYEIDNDTHLII